MQALAGPDWDTVFVQLIGSEVLVSFEQGDLHREPAAVQSFRLLLLESPSVKQLFDPWFLESDTQDARAPVANMQRGSSTSNERLHAHHLHITIHEPRIL